MKRLGMGSLTVAFLLELSVGIASGAAFRLSFLDDRAVLEDTCQLLRQSGCSEESAIAFKGLVEHHNKAGNRVDRTKFPDAASGYYQFQSLADLTNRLPGIFADVPANSSLDQNTLMCFDVACLLLRGAGCEASRFDQDFESKGIVLVGADGSTKAVGYDAFRSGQHLLYPEMGYEHFVGKPRSEAETRLGLSLGAARHLAKGDLNRREGVQAAFVEYVVALERDGFQFPQGFRLGLGLYVNPKSRYLVGDHAFLCIPKSGWLICIEKNGSRGPYVRVEFKSEADLGRYISWSLLRDVDNPKKKEYGNSVLVSLNDQLIGIFVPMARL
jgi:hypothetical protein